MSFLDRIRYISNESKNQPIIIKLFIIIMIVLLIIVFLFLFYILFYSLSHLFITYYGFFLCYADFKYDCNNCLNYTSNPENIKNCVCIGLSSLLQTIISIIIFAIPYCIIQILIFTFKNCRDSYEEGLQPFVDKNKNEYTSINTL